MLFFFLTIPEWVEIHQTDSLLPPVGLNLLQEKQQTNKQLRASEFLRIEAPLVSRSPCLSFHGKLKN